jgi:D-cysteine desulfhydrase family pyridoxal phosphate-dependent enzyme
MIPRLRFAFLPTPIENMPRLSALLGGPRLLIKRDDQTGLALGGNKTRKLEFLLAEARANGAKTLITAGAVQSNHCRQTAAIATRFGLDCILVLAGNSPGQPSGNLILDQLFGAEIIWSTIARREEALKQAFNQAWADGRRPYLIPYGGSNATGALAYAFAMEELMAQNVEPDWIIFPSSSGGTQAGLVLGARRYGFKGKVLGISVDATKNALQEWVAHLATEASENFEKEIPKGTLHFYSEEILVNADYLGGGYGVMGLPEREAILLFARYEGQLLDPVYTGRAGAALIDLVRNGFFKSKETVLFWHTGGIPALFADLYMGDLGTDTAL